MVVRVQKVVSQFTFHLAQVSCFGSEMFWQGSGVVFGEGRKWRVGKGGYSCFACHCCWTTLTTCPREGRALLLLERPPVMANRSFTRGPLWLNFFSMVSTSTLVCSGQFLTPSTAVAFFSAIPRFKCLSIASVDFS